MSILSDTIHATHIINEHLIALKGLTEHGVLVSMLVDYSEGLIELTLAVPRFQIEVSHKYTTESILRLKNPREALYQDFLYLVTDLDFDRETK